MADLLSLLGRLPSHLFFVWVIWLLATAGLAFYTARAVRQASESNTPSQSAQVTAAPGTTIYQAGRDINVLADPRTIGSIQSLTLEARLICTLKRGAVIPPSEVDFLPVGDAHAYLEGPTGRDRLAFVSPVRFHLMGDDRVSVINRFALDPASSIANRPLEALASFQNLSVPIVTVVYGQALETMTLLEVTVSINGAQVWYGSWPYDVAFQQGPRFSVPLDEFRKQIRGG